MKKAFVNIGFGNVVATDKIIAIIRPESAPIKRLIQTAKQEKKLVDATAGRRTRSLIATETGHYIISAIQVETIVHRIEDYKIED